ncbi:oxidoreductase [Thozetella sp. PMI_491]|nr:oxidoreductase [Thozetella sp. PMI_491]
MDVTGNAAWVDCPGEPCRIGPNKMREPKANEVLIKNSAIAINPYDCFLQDTGAFVENWPAIFGIDISGQVVAVGQDVRDIFLGQRVLAHALCTGLQDAGFQSHTLVPAHVVSQIPDRVTFEDACTLPLAVGTAAAGLYQDGYLALPHPSPIPGAYVPSKMTLLIWGGSSSVGSAAIQLAVASGLQVVTTCSKTNMGLCSKLGASQVFDRNSPTIEDDMVEALKSIEVVGAFAAISTDVTIKAVARILSKLGGGFIAATKAPPKDLPENVTSRMVFASDYCGVDGKKYYRDFLPTALETGVFRPALHSYVVGGGLESVQAGLDELRSGVSARKIVVTL